MEHRRQDRTGATRAASSALKPEEGRVFKMLGKPRTFRDEEGQDLLEYALLLGFVVVASVGVLTTMSGDIGAIWTVIATRLASTD